VARAILLGRLRDRRGLGLGSVIKDVRRGTERVDQSTGDANKQFQGMLRWLDLDSERAGQKYEEIRRRLIFILRCRGCSFPDDLADKCFDRVAQVTSRPNFSYEGDPALFFYGVAKLMVKEHFRTKFVVAPNLEDDLPEMKEIRSQCLDKCMAKLSPRNRELILEYYGHVAGPKTVYRSQLADRLGMPINALRIQMYRIRELLRQCVLQCTESKIE
jgi:DNA-directed RNA polymerase specialized sigma24 family protein